MWTKVSFGKWAGKNKTLPQILLNDPDWFFWAIDSQILPAGLVEQAEILARRAKSIRLPVPLRDTHVVAYSLMNAGSFAGVALIPKTQPKHIGSSIERRSFTLDLSIVRSLKHYDKLGNSLLLKTFKHHWFSNKPFTKERIEAFFSQADNFFNP